MADYEISQEMKDRWALVNEADRAVMMLEFAYQTSETAKSTRRYIIALLSLASFGFTWAFASSF